MTNSDLFYRASPSNPYYFDGTRNGTISQYFGPNTKNVSKESFLGMIQGLQNLPKKKAIESNEGLPSNVGDRQNKSEAQTLDDSIKKLCQKGSLPKVYSTANNKDLLCMAREAFCKLPPDIRRTLEDKGKLGEFLDNVCYDDSKKTLHDCYKDLIAEVKNDPETSNTPPPSENISQNPSKITSSNQKKVTIGELLKNRYSFSQKAVKAGHKVRTVTTITCFDNKREEIYSRTVDITLTPRGWTPPPKPRSSDIPGQDSVKTQNTINHESSGNSNSVSSQR